MNEEILKALEEAFHQQQTHLLSILIRSKDEKHRDELRLRANVMCDLRETMSRALELLKEKNVEKRLNVLNKSSVTYEGLGPSQT